MQFKSVKIITFPKWLGFSFFFFDSIVPICRASVQISNGDGSHSRMSAEVYSVVIT